ncbi:MAG: hypothetical protein Ta2D_06600 [Rickettsiales bacterium]|nr:MAG: hypothetical protein Ta2D_06600 [Rickettsiales bacterium]
MCILLNKNKFLLFLILCCACSIIEPREANYTRDKRWKEQYEGQVKKMKKKHEKSIKDADYKGASFENTAMGRLKAEEQAFLVKNAEVKPYREAEEAGGPVVYLSNNVDKYKEEEIDIFSEIKPDDDDFKNYDLGRKEYIEIGNKELQQDYDIIVSNSKEYKDRQRLRELERLEEQQRDSGVFNRMTDGLKKFGTKIKGLLDKKK